MTDATRLAAGLDAYMQALERHFALLREEHRQLQSVWAPTRETYRGEGADVFAEAWQRADAEFRHYLDQGQRILVLLRQRLDALQRFDRPAAGA